MSDHNISNRVDQVADNAYVKMLSRLALPAMALIGLQVWDGQKETSKDISTLIANQMVISSKMQEFDRRIDSVEKWQNSIMFSQSETVKR